MGKSRLLGSVVCMALVAAMAFPALAQASESAYSIYVPAAGNVYTDTVGGSSSTARTFYLSAPTKRLGTQYKYGGGKSMAFQGCVPGNHATWSASIVIPPSGSGASTHEIAKMYPGTTSGYVAASLNSALGVIVTVLAQGDWVYNY